MSVFVCQFKLSVYNGCVGFPLAEVAGKEGTVE